MKLEFKFEGTVFDTVTAVEQALSLKEQIRAASNSTTRQYLENKLNALYSTAIGLGFDTKSSNFKKL